MGQILTYILKKHGILVRVLQHEVVDLLEFTVHFLLQIPEGGSVHLEGLFRYGATAVSR
ncbi:hypothetical protein D3C73_1278200 [compost metagenome]